MTNQIETAREWLADLNKIIDKTDNECTKEKRDALEWLVESVEELEDKLYELNESAYQTQIDFLETNGKKNKLLEENKRLQEFYDYFANLHGNGLEVSNYHLNGSTEPFDTFFDEAEEVLKGESR